MPVGAAPDTLLGGVYSTPGADAATGARAWLSAMLRVESALARAGARLGLIPEEAGRAITAACDPSGYGPDVLEALARGAAIDATPVPELLRQLRARLPEQHTGFLHLAATSQDVLDTALALIAADVVAGLGADVTALTDMLAGLAAEHRDTVQVGRTLLQHAALTTFGAACAARMVGIDEAYAGLRRVRRERLAVQLGGPVGTLAPTGGQGPAYVEAVAVELGLTVPVLPWHTSRGRFAELAAAAGVLAGELGGLAQDLVLLSSSEIGELVPGRPGGSSSLPHKRNPAAAVLALACAARTPGQVATVLAAMPQELQRSAGRWQSEWGALSELLRLTAAAAAHCRTAVDGLQVQRERMAGNVEMMREALGQPDAGGTGSAQAFVDRALTAHAAAGQDQS